MNSVFTTIKTEPKDKIAKVYCPENKLCKDAFRFTPLTDLHDKICCLPDHFQVQTNRLDQSLLPHLWATIGCPEDHMTAQAYILLDTGSSHSLMSKKYLQKYFPNLKVQMLKVDFSHAGETTKEGVIGKVS